LSGIAADRGPLFPEKCMLAWFGRRYLDVLGSIYIYN
jgi:hypothetical protein